MKNEIIITNPNDLTTLVGDILEEKLIVLKQWFESLNHQTERPLNKKQAMEHLGMPLSTFNRYVKKGIIPKRSLGGRVYFKLNELNEAMVLTNNFKNLKLVS